MPCPSQAGRGGIVDPGLDEHLGDLSVFVPNMVPLKQKYNKDFMKCVWVFDVPVSCTKTGTRELVKVCGQTVTQADLSDAIVWALVKLMDNRKSWTGKLF